MDDQSSTAIHHFWEWFGAHLADLDAMTDPDGPVADELLARLQAVNSELWFEISSPGHTPREFVITAQGQVALFELVEEMAHRAPALPGWQVVPLKPPMGFGFGIRYEGIDFDPAQMWFEPLTSEEMPQLLGLRVAVPGFLEENEQECGNATLILLDTALGERSAATDIELVEVCELPGDPEEAGFFRLSELMNYLEWRRNRPGRAN
jgi:hypothetical protein